jgi:hypothetical protein
MGQLGFFDLNRRYESLTEKNDPPLAIGGMVPFESFRPKLHTNPLWGCSAAKSWVSALMRLVFPTPPIPTSRIEFRVSSTLTGGGS